MSTDKTILIQCGECGDEIEGILPMTEHISNCHKAYNYVEAMTYAKLWAIDAYEREEMGSIAYGEDKRLHDAIHDNGDY